METETMTMYAMYLPYLRERWLREENEKLRAMLRESLKWVGDGRWHEQVYEALGEPKPPTRKLKGKIPRYQQELIKAGKLKD